MITLVDIDCIPVLIGEINIDQDGTQVIGRIRVVGEVDLVEIALVGADIGPIDIAVAVAVNDGGLS